MKLKYLALPLAGLFAAFFCLLLLVALLFASDEDGGRGGIYYGGANLSAEVLAHRPMVERYAAQYGISEYVDVLLAIMQVESGGTLEDVMQSSESMGLPPNSLDTESSIRQGCEYFSELLAKADRLGCDLDSVIQAYNYGGGFLDYVASTAASTASNWRRRLQRKSPAGCVLPTRMKYPSRKTAAGATTTAICSMSGWYRSICMPHSLITRP